MDITLYQKLKNRYKKRSVAIAIAGFFIGCLLGYCGGEVLFADTLTVVSEVNVVEIAEPTETPTSVPPIESEFVTKRTTGETKYGVEAEYIAKTIWGEARGCSPEEQAKVVWCILNRVDDGRFGQDIVGVVTMPNQFVGYSASHPVTDEHYKIAVDTIDKWQREKVGEKVVRELANDKLYFSSDGRGNNIFR